MARRMLEARQELPDNGWTAVDRTSRRYSYECIRVHPLMCLTFPIGTHSPGGKYNCILRLRAVFTTYPGHLAAPGVKWWNNLHVCDGPNWRYCWSGRARGTS